MSMDAPSPTEPLFMLDVPKLVPVSPRESFLKGWFVPPPTVKSYKLILSVDGAEHAVYTGFPRPDVRRSVGSRARTRSGFLAVLPTPAPGQQVSMYAQMDGVRHELAGGIPVEDRTALPEINPCDGTVSSYKEWIFGCEPKLFERRTFFGEDLSVNPRRPQISLLAEFRECHVYLVSRFLQSLSAQLYPEWQLCLAGDFDGESEAFQSIKNFAASESRVTLIPVRHAGNNRLYNAALEAADGEFVASARIWDELHPAALLEAAARLGREEAQVIYSDEDEIDLLGQRYRPRFKPDFDAERLLSFNYIQHFTAIRRTLILKSGGYRSGPPDAREWDLLLRCCEQIGPDQVIHIAKPLYHQRSREALSESGLLPSPPQADGFCQVLHDHVARTGKQATVQAGSTAGTLRLRHQIPNVVRVSVFLRDQDGAFQTSAFTALSNRYQVEFYGVLNDLLHRLSDPFAGRNRSSSTLPPPLVSFEEIPGDVLIFINRPINSLNHHFVQELTAEALRLDCGLVTGLSVDLEGKFIHTGFIKEGNQYLDPFAGASSRNRALAQQVRVMRSVSAVSADFFAVRRERVRDAGATAALNSSNMPQFVGMLTESAHRLGLRIFVTPYAVASFDDFDVLPPSSGSRQGKRRAVAAFNPNLTAFSDPYLLPQI